MDLLLMFIWTILSLSGHQTYSELDENRMVYVPAGDCFKLPCECLSLQFGDVEWHKKYFCDDKEKEKILEPFQGGTSLKVKQASKDMCTVGVFTCRFIDLQSNKTRSCQSFDVRVYECVVGPNIKKQPIVFPPANVTDSKIGDTKTFTCSVKFPCDRCLDQHYSFSCTPFKCQLPIYDLSWYFTEETEISRVQQHHISEEPRYNVSYEMINGGTNIYSNLTISLVESVDFTRDFLCVVTMNNTNSFWEQNYRAVLKQRGTKTIVVAWKFYFSVLILVVFPLAALLWKYKFQIRSKCFCRMAWLRTKKEFDVLVLSYDESRTSRRIIEYLKMEGYNVACSDNILGNRDEMSVWSDLCSSSGSIVIVNSSEYYHREDIQNFYELLIKSVKKIIAPEFITLIFEDTIQKQFTFGVQAIILSNGVRSNYRKLYKRMPKPSKRYRQAESEPIFAIQNSYMD